MRKRNNNYYPQGYLGKIAYHIVQGNLDKVQYFVNRQTQTYGAITREDDQIISRLIFEYRE